jgi:hypothetical protein
MSDFHQYFLVGNPSIYLTTNQIFCSYRCDQIFRTIRLHLIFQECCLLASMSEKACSQSLRSLVFRLLDVGLRYMKANLITDMNIVQSNSSKYLIS